MVIVKNCPSTAVNLGRYVASCNTPNDLPHRVCIPNKTDYLNLDVFNMITRINESKKIQNISINDGKMFITINVGASVNIKNIVCAKKYIIGILLHIAAKMVNSHHVILTISDHVG